MFIAAFGSMQAAASPSTCASWHGGGSASLQSAVNANLCVTVQPGTWHLTSRVALPAGHTLTGLAGKDASTILFADPSTAWGCCNGMIDVNPQNPLTTANATVSHLTLEAAHRAIIGIAGGVVTASDVHILDTVCNG